MAFDVTSVLVTLTTGTLTLAVALPAVMGRVGRPARLAQVGAGLQAAGWTLLLVSDLVAPGSGLDRLLSTLSMACLSGGMAANAAAFDLWCGAPSPSRAPTVVAVLLTIGYALGFASYSFRFAWANGLLALQMALIAARLSRPTAVPVGRWRWLLVVSLAVQVVMTVWRGVLGAFFSASLPAFASGHPVNLAFALVANATSMLSMIGVLLAHRDEASRELERLAALDGLTQLLNRRAWFLRATTELAVSRRYDHPLALLMIDIDHFKGVNDAHGHQAGDRALQFVARALAAAVRTGDIVGRYGGEEFCVLMHHADDDAARAFDTRLRARFDGDATAELGFPLNYSAGIARRLAGDETLEAMLRRADLLLYQAKHEGRSRTLDGLGERMQPA